MLNIQYNRCLYKKYYLFRKTLNSWVSDWYKVSTFFAYLSSSMKIMKSQLYWGPQQNIASPDKTFTPKMTLQIL